MENCFSFFFHFCHEQTIYKIKSTAYTVKTLHLQYSSNCYKQQGLPSVPVHWKLKAPTFSHCLVPMFKESTRIFWRGSCCFRLRFNHSSQRMHGRETKKYISSNAIYTHSLNESPSWGSTRCMGIVQRCFMPRIKSECHVRSHRIWREVIKIVGILSPHSVSWMRRRKHTALVCRSMLSQWTWAGRYW